MQLLPPPQGVGQVERGTGAVEEKGTFTLSNSHHLHVVRCSVNGSCTYKIVVCGADPVQRAGPYVLGTVAHVHPFWYVWWARGCRRRRWRPTTAFWCMFS